jgi:hypothetical protein
MPRRGAPILFRALCEKGGIPRPSRAWDFPSLTTRPFFITFFLYGHHRHRIAIAQ